MNFVETLLSAETKLRFVSVEEESLLACIHLWASSSTGRALPAVCKFGEDGAPLSIPTLAVPHIKAEQAFKEGAGSRAFLQRSTRVWSLPPTVQPTNSAGSSLKKKQNIFSPHVMLKTLGVQGPTQDVIEPRKGVTSMYERQEIGRQLKRRN